MSAERHPAGTSATPPAVGVLVLVREAECFAGPSARMGWNAFASRSSLARPPLAIAERKNATPNHCSGVAKSATAVADFADAAAWPQRPPSGASAWHHAANANATTRSKTPPPLISGASRDSRSTSGSSSESSKRPSGFCSRKRRISRSKASRLRGASSRDADGGAPARRRRRTTRKAAKKSPRVVFDATSPTTRATTRRLAAVRRSERFPVIRDPARDTTPIGCVMMTQPTDGYLF
mmetsp:Transcript_14610/g.61639  ORF Transcript_14610/g.61639 Transcript_14610/m.61639 type:complete len:237 (-) Transcript_14610:406-1116(-)